MDWDDLNVDTQNEWLTKAEYLIKRGYVNGAMVDLTEFAKKLYLKRINSSSRESAETLPLPKQ